MENNKKNASRKTFIIDTSVLLYDKFCPGSKAYFEFTEEFLEQDKKIESAA